MHYDLTFTDMQMRAARSAATRAGEEGQEAWIARSRTITTRLEALLLRPGLCLKVFAPREDWDTGHPGSYLWAGTPLGVATRIQNMFALHGLAPRVYGLATVNGEYAAQIVDYAQDVGKADVSKAEKVAERYHIGIKDLEHSEATRKAYLARPEKWVGSQLVDFGRFMFPDWHGYEVHLRRHVARYHKKVHGGADTKIGYQPCPELKVAGKRDVAARWKQMGLDKMDLSGKRCLDIGCNQGAFTRLLEQQGAARVVGVDHKFASGNRELANWLACWRADFLEVSLPKHWHEIEKQTGIAQFDLVLCLSVLGHAGGYASWFPRLVAPGGTVLFEGQGSDSRDTYQAVLERDFAKVEWLGETRDHGVHPTWRLTKEA